VLRVVLAEDNLLVRAGTKQLLQSTGEIEVVGEASDAVEAAALVRDLAPDAVLTDIRMPPSFRLEGIELALEIRAKNPETGVVVLSSHDDPEYALTLFKDGSAGLGYLLKERVAEPEQLIGAVREVSRGGTVMDPKVVDILVSREVSSSGVSTSDQQLLELMGKGMSYAEMAERMEIPVTAVDLEVSRVLARLAEAASRGVQVALTELRKLHGSVVEKEQHTAALSRFLSPQVARGVVARELLEPADLELTVIFTDVRGFTRLTESTDPQVMRRLLDEHLTAMSDIVLQRDGMVDKFIGDAVMAVFGAPVRTPDHAERALGCAEAMLLRQDELNERWVSEGHPPFAVGIGVNTGTATAGSVGGAKLEYTVVGDAVNVAQRLNSLASGGEIVASEATATAAGIPPREVETVSVKGREGQVRVVRLRPATSDEGKETT
jgi:class 3 adenylate cyclase/DNA-binding NarL/FixJ family response regulator